MTFCQLQEGGTRKEICIEVKNFVVNWMGMQALSMKGLSYVKSINQLDMLLFLKIISNQNYYFIGT